MTNVCGQGHNGTQAQNGAVRQVGTGDGSKPQSKGGLTVQCALEGACVLLERDTLLSEALQLLDEAEQSVALIVSPLWRSQLACALCQTFVVPCTGDLMLLSFCHDWGWLTVTGLLKPQESQHLYQALLGLTMLFCADDLAWHFGDAALLCRLMMMALLLVC